MPEPVAIQTATVKQRLQTMFDLFLENSTFNKPTKTIIQTLARQFFTDKLTDEEIKKQLIYLRDEILPLILGE